MEITIKDVLYLMTYFVTFITLILSMKNTQSNMTQEIKLLRNIIFGEKGSLNIVDQATLKAALDQVWIRIRHNEAAMNMILQEIKMLNRNVMAIMFKLKINMPDMPKIIEEDDND